MARLAAAKERRAPGSPAATHLPLPAKSHLVLLRLHLRQSRPLLLWWRVSPAATAAAPPGRAPPPPPPRARSGSACMSSAPSTRADAGTAPLPAARRAWPRDAPRTAARATPARWRHLTPAVLLFARGVRKMERALPAATLREMLPRFLSVCSLLIFPASSNLSSLLCSSL